MFEKQVITMNILGIKFNVSDNSNWFYVFVLYGLILAISVKLAQFIIAFVVFGFFIAPEFFPEIIQNGFLRFMASFLSGFLLYTIVDKVIDDEN